MSMLPSGSQAKLHGLTRPFVTTDMRIFTPSAASNVHGPSPNAPAGIASGGPPPRPWAGGGLKNAKKKTKVRDPMNNPRRVHRTGPGLRRRRQSFVGRVLLCRPAVKTYPIAIGFPGEPVAPFSLNGANEYMNS